MRQPEEIEQDRDYDYRGTRTNEDEPVAVFTGAYDRKSKLRDRRARKGYRNGGYSDLSVETGP